MDLTHVDSPPNARPAGFVDHQFDFEFQIAASSERVWAWLNDPRTFMEGQVWPFKVEVLTPSGPAASDDPSGSGPASSSQQSEFAVGGINVHHGPLMSFAGVFTEIQPSKYRCLDYFYGSYVLSLRLIRPTRLEFWLEEEIDHGQTRVRLRVSSYVSTRISRLWTRAQAFFWKRFPSFMSGAMGAKVID